jgi:DnaJ-class molecular chaperone
MSKRDYYEILGVQKGASEADIRRAHRKLVRQYHPDVNKDNASAVEKFKEVQEAYDVLSDPAKRKRYDQFGHAGVGNLPPGSSGPYEGYRQSAGPRARTWQGAPGTTVEDFDFGDIGNGGMSDVFEQFFGSRAGRRQPGYRAAPRPARGPDIEYPITLTFAQAARGTTLALKLSRGNAEESIEVRIPPGVKDGSRVRIKGKGDAGRGEPGDLFIIVSVAPHPYYRREGLDILLELPLSLYEALLGAKLEVPTLDGPITLTIPPGTSSGSKLRIKGRGVFRGDEKGDQYVVTKVILPRTLDESDRKLLEELQRKHPINAREDVEW